MRSFKFAMLPLLLGSALALGATSAQAHAPVSEPPTPQPQPQVVLVGTVQHIDQYRSAFERLGYAVTPVADYVPVLADSCYGDYSPALLPISAPKRLVQFRAVQAEYTLVPQPLPFMGYMKGYYGRKLLAGNFYWHVTPAHFVPIDQPTQGVAGVTV